MRLFFPSLDAAKARARHLEAACVTYGAPELTHSRALELFAKMSGYASWSELKALGQDPTAPLDPAVDRTAVASRLSDLAGVSAAIAEQICARTFAKVDQPSLDPIYSFTLASFPRAIAERIAVAKSLSDVKRVSDPDQHFCALFDKPLAFTLEDVLEIFACERRHDVPTEVALIGPVSDKWSALKKGVPVTDQAAMRQRLESRHEILLFRIAVAEGQPRYLVFPTKPYERMHHGMTPVFITGSRSAAAFAAGFKEAHASLGHPALE